MHIFYTPDLAVADVYELNEEESRHCSKVLRLGVGSQVYLIDGKGGLYTAEIVMVEKRNVRLKVISLKKEFGKRNHHLHIAIAPTKNIERLEWFLEKATEIGIDEVTPLICDHSERKAIKSERLEKVMTAAVKQSLTAYHPRLNPLTSFAEFVHQPFEGNRFVAHCVEDDSKRYIADFASGGGSCRVLIGPEGDFSAAEINLAMANGYKPVTLGDSRLRTETAGLAACFEVNFLNRSR